VYGSNCRTGEKPLSAVLAISRKSAPVCRREVRSRLARGPWRKEARHGTDRALRYRANACPPPRHALEPPLTKSARPVGDTEKVAQEWLRGASGFERRAILPYQRATVSPQYWPFPASPGHRAANQKNREFVASSFGSSETRVSKTVSQGALRGFLDDCYLPEVLRPFALK
jgi:hypothetical protein